ncbi:MAG: FAD-binding protein, partial [Verrucomicrobia bacterium]|nr:FAD-binding protein [Verrucomicrobiota bacterium]
MKKPEVLIVGAGPAGLTLAIECARYRVPVRIVDHNTAHSTQSKALAIWSGTLECFGAMGVVDEFLKVARPIKDLIFADRGKILNKIPSNRGIDSVYPSPVILPQSQTEEILERHLAALGVTVERQVELKNFSQDENSVTAELQHADGACETTTVSYLAGCDGARSAVRHGLKLDFLGETEQMNFVLIDAKVEGDLKEDAVFINWNEDYTVAFFPVKAGVFRMFTQRKDLHDQSTPTLEEMQGYLDKTGLGHLRFYDAEWLSHFSV